MNTLRKLIELFLILNPKPADAQVHALAGALGMDKEALEAEIYEMLGSVVDEKEGNLNSDEVLSDAGLDSMPADDDITLASITEVLDGDYDPDTTNNDDLAANDGDTDQEDITEEQKLTDDDGSLSDSDLTNINDTQALLTDDGLPEVQLEQPL